MTDLSQQRIQTILHRTARKRRRREAFSLFRTGALSALLAAAVGFLLRDMMPSRFILGAAGYGSVLLQEGAGAYVVVGIVAFVAGVAATVFCLRWRTTKLHRITHAEESEEIL